MSTESVIPLNGLNETCCWSNMPFSVKWPIAESTTLKEAPNRVSIRKKKRQRTMYSTQQIQYLEDVYSRQRYISKIDRQAITRHLNLGDRQVKIWFQNRRMKSKREMEEKVLSRTPDESAKSDATLESRSSDASDHVFSDIMTTIQDDVGTENSNYQLPTYTPPRQEQFISSTYCPNNWNFQQNDLLGFYGDVQYPTEYYPTYFDHNSFQYSAAQNLGSEANSAKGCGSATTYYKFW